MLLQHEKIQIDHQDNNGQTAFMLASRGGYKEIAQILESKFKKEY